MKFCILGLSLSDKSFVYLAGLQVQLYDTFAFLFSKIFLYISALHISSLSSASFLIWETFCSTWSFWHTSRPFVSPEYIWNPQAQGNAFKILPEM